MTSQNSRISLAFVPYFSMGLLSILLQVLAVRELLTVFSGNELSIGLTLAMWLILVGAGSLTGSRLRSTAVFGLTFLALGLLAWPSVVFMRSLRTVLSLAPGETVSLGASLLWTFITLTPVCFTAGLQFPLAVSQKGGDNPAGRVYAIEAGGAFAGGLLFVFVLSGRVDSMSTALGLSLLSILIGAYLLKRKALLVLVAVPLALHVFLMPEIPKGAVERVQSRYGEIWVTSLRSQLNFYSSGHLLYAYPDVQTEELRAHMPMTLHPSPKEILLIGGSAGTLREFLKYPIERLDFLEIDPALIRVALKHLTHQDRPLLDDSRLRVIAQDGRRFVKSLKARAYDLVVLNLPEPSTANMNRFYTTDFFKEVSAALKEGGILALVLPTSPGYVGKRMQIANGSIYNSLKSVFSHVEVTTEEYGWLFASASAISTEPETLLGRFRQRALHLKFFDEYILSDAFTPLRAGLYRERLSKAEALNTDRRPVAYLYNLLLWAEAHRGRALNALLKLKDWQVILLLPGALILCAVFFFRRGRHTLYYSISTTGYMGMALTLTIVLGLQARAGYVYEMIGLITALFMAGTALGAGLAGGLRNPLRGLFLLEVGSVVFATALPFLFITEAIYYVLSLLAGLLTGAQFSTVSQCLERHEAGRIYALDLMGAFISALLTAIILIPLLGIKGAVAVAAWAKTVSALLVVFIYKRQ